MDKAQIEELNQRFEASGKAFEKRVKEYAEKTHMFDHWARPIVRAQVTIEGLQARIASKMGVLPNEAARVARKIAGNRKKDVENLTEYGVANWALSRCYLTLSQVEDMAKGDSPFPAVISLAEVAHTLMFAMDVMAKESRARNGSKGGEKSAAVTKEVKSVALKLAKEMAPPEGWGSAPMAAERIFDDVLTFAETKGRRPSRRKVEEWLRSAGIKKIRT